jgi:hypothetical protein
MANLRLDPSRAARDQPESTAATQSHYQGGRAGSPAGYPHQFLRQPAAQEFAVKAPAL